MDAIDPAILKQAEAVAQQQARVKELRRLRMRWMGHRLYAEVYIAVEPHLTTVQSHHVAEELRHDLFHQVPNLAEVVVHVDPWGEQLETVHQLTEHHEPIPRPFNG
jgi:divalent metal cation (Fe/Co/Zn/Cd) transporter